MDNETLVEQFELLTKLMELYGENAFKVKSYKGAAFQIEKIEGKIEMMSPSQIRSIPGIGEAITQQILAYKETGMLALLQDYIQKTPSGILEIMRIKGLGPKKVALLWTQLGIESVGELEYACQENRLTELKGFGLKTQAAILQQIQFLKSNQGSFLWAEVENLADTLRQQLQERFPKNRIEFTGEYRRQMPIVKHIELITDLLASSIQDYFKATEHAVFQNFKEALVVEINDNCPFYFHLSTKENFEKKMFLTSSSEDFQNAFNSLYQLPPQPCSEQEIFEYNNLIFIPPFQREHPTILEKSSQNILTEPLGESSIKGLVHCHSTWSDGSDTLEAMARAAIAKKWQYMVITDHSKAAFYANGLSEERVMEQHKQIDQLNEILAPFRIFKGIEADILFDGTLDYGDSFLSNFELVVASVHSHLKMDETKATQRLISAIENPNTTILGHPTGRLLLSRAGYPMNYQKVIDACASNGVIIEINAHPRRLDLDWQWVGYALEKGALLSVNPDAHSVSGIDLIKYGILTAQKGGLTASCNLSSFSLHRFEEHIQKRH